MLRGWVECRTVDRCAMVSCFCYPEKEMSRELLDNGEATTPPDRHQNSQLTLIAFKVKCATMIELSDAGQLESNILASCIFAAISIPGSFQTLIDQSVRGLTKSSTRLQDRETRV